MSIAILPPDVNVSDVFFHASGPGIRFGLAAIKNVGESAISSIVAQKPFKTLFDFCDRVDSRAVNKRVIESLIKAGHSTALLAIVHCSMQTSMAQSNWVSEHSESGSRPGRTVWNADADWRRSCPRAAKSGPRD
jgi:DNA polymerase III alpha subunit